MSALFSVTDPPRQRHWFGEYKKGMLRKCFVSLKTTGAKVWLSPDAIETRQVWFFVLRATCSIKPKITIRQVVLFVSCIGRVRLWHTNYAK
jgi:hypothetical protein